MSAKDKLDIFMESQLLVNQTNAETMKALGVTVADLEKHSVEMKNLVQVVNGIASTTKENSSDISDLKLDVGFVRDAKWVFRAIMLALIIGAGSAAWQTIKSNQAQPLSIADVELIIKTIQSGKDKQ